MRNRAGRDQRHRLGAIARVRCNRAARAGVKDVDGLLVAQDRPAQRLVLVDHILQMIEDDVVGRVARLPQFLQHHLALAFQFARLDRSELTRMSATMIQRQRHIVLQDAGMEGGLLAAGIGVEIAADRFDLFGDLARAARWRCP